MIHLALSIAAFLFLAWCACILGGALLWLVGMVFVTIIECVVWPIEVVRLFIRNLGNR
jgi:hypothetical protein